MTAFLRGTLSRWRGRQVSLVFGGEDRGFEPMSALHTFCRQIRSRSAEHESAMRLLFGNRLLGLMVSILRQELDSMIRVIYLLSIKDRTERNRLIEASVDGQQWTVKGKKARITDKEMAELTESLHGWTGSVYRFGCAFIHLSAFHDYSDRDPFASLPASERHDLLEHMRSYHGGPSESNPSFHDLAPYLPRVLEKIAGNLECYLKQLETGEDLEKA